MELSIDTSTRYASVGLSRNGEAIRELTWRSERNHSVELVPAIQEIMEHVGTSTKELEAIFIAIGPGAFSALRVGMSTAKAMSASLKIPLASASTLDIEAQPYLGLGHPVVAIIGAGRTRFYIGKYNSGSSSRNSQAEPQYEVVSSDSLPSEVEQGTLLCGEGIRDMPHELKRQLSGALFAEVPPPTRRAGILAHLAHKKLLSGQADDAMTLEPIYLRGTQVAMAQETWTKK